MIFLQNRFAIFSVLIIFIYIAPFLVLGEQSFVLIHDMLDHHIAKFKTLAESDLIFGDSSSQLDMLMNAPRVAFGSEIKLVFWLFYFFDPFDAYVINQVLLRLIAFTGMLLLLNNYVFLKDQNRFSILVSLLFALLPFYSTAGISVAGLPLISYIFLKIRAGNDHYKDWIILITFPLYSSLVFSMMFYIIFICFLWLYDIFNYRVSIKFTISIALLSIIFLITNYRLVETFFFGLDFTSHRVEMATVGSSYGFFEAVIKSGKHFVLGQYHAHSMHIIFLPIILFVFFKNITAKSKNSLFLVLFVLNVLISLWYGFWDSEVLSVIREPISSFLPINLIRFHILSPFIWYVLLALAIKDLLLVNNFFIRDTLVKFIFSITLIFLFIKSDFINEYRLHNISYKSFYSENLFNKIDNYINEEQETYKVVSIGIHPSIARYNNFYTLDGYLTNYDLKYKHNFRNIIAPELQKNKELESYFDDWGSRCYVFINDIGKNFMRNKNQVYPITVTLDTIALYNMGGRYVFSSYKILNFKENNMSFLEKFEDDESAWDIYLYEVNALN